MKLLLSILVLAVLPSCGGTSVSTSATKDVPLINQTNLVKKVLYREDQTVLLVICPFNTPEPILRNCSEKGPIDSMPLQEYLDLLPGFATGPHSRTPEGLASLQITISKQDEGTQDQASQQRLQELKKYRDDLIKILEISDALNAATANMDYSKDEVVLTPFLASIDSDSVKSIADIVKLMEKGAPPASRHYSRGISGRNAVEIKREGSSEISTDFPKYYKKFSYLDKMGEFYLSEINSAYTATPVDLSKGTFSLTFNDGCFANFSIRKYKNYMFISTYMTGTCLYGSDYYASAVYVPLY